MSAYHNAVSDKLIVSIFPGANVHAVYSKEHQLKWSTVSEEILPIDLVNAIFSSSTIISSLGRFTLAPANMEDPKKFFEANFSNVGSLKTSSNEDFNIIEETHKGYKSVVDLLINTEEYSDVGLFYGYGAQKTNGDSLFFYPANNGVTIAAWKEGKFMLMNRYPADNLDETFYYIMLVVEQLELNAENLYFECICSKGAHESYHAMFKNYLASLHLYKLDEALDLSSVSDDRKQILILAQFFAQCVL
jgi:hypothetical protein